MERHGEVGGTGRLAGLWESLRSFGVGGEGIVLVVSLFVSQARLSLHLLTLCEAQAEPGLHREGPRATACRWELERARDSESDGAAAGCAASASHSSRG